MKTELLKKILKFFPYSFLSIFILLFIIYLYQSFFYKSIVFYFYNPTTKILQKDEIVYKWYSSDPIEAMDEFFINYEKGTPNYQLKNVFLHGNSVNVTTLFPDKKLMIIDFQQRVITRLNNQKEEKNLIDGIITTLKYHKSHTDTVLYRYLADIDEVRFSFGGYPFNVVKGAYNYQLPFSLKEE